jgi:primase-polymerase (primpol)-like protein
VAGQSAQTGQGEVAQNAYTPLEYTSKNSAAWASATDPSTWRSFAEAVQAYRLSQKWSRPFDGIGFVFDRAIGEDGLTYCGVDWDTWTDQAQAQYATLKTYSEVSPSGNGVHAIARAKPFKQAVCKTEDFSGEAYCTGRYFTFSGNLVDGAVPTLEARPDEIAEVIAEIEAAAMRKRTICSSGSPSRFL